jgi:hypothetical protein
METDTRVITPDIEALETDLQKHLDTHLAPQVLAICEHME